MSQNGKKESYAIRWALRPMKQEDIERCLVIWSKVKLTEGYQTVSSSLASDPDGFFVAELEETGKIIGMCASTVNGIDTNFIGFYGVDPEFQGIGVGRALWSKTMSRLDSSMNIGLYGVHDMIENYRRSGFTIEDSIKMLVFESIPFEPLQLNLLKNIGDLNGCRLIRMDTSSDPANIQKLIDYDQSVLKFSREKLLRLYLTGDDVPLTLAVIKDTSRGERKSSCCAKPIQESIIEDENLSNATKTSLTLSTSIPDELSSSSKSSLPADVPSLIGSGSSQKNLSDNLAVRAGNSTGNFEILGYGCIRLDNNVGGMVGPIYADSSDICEVLLRNLMDRFNLQHGRIFSVLALDCNKHSCKILTKIGLKEMERCSRMFTKFVPAASFSKIYYIHSPNFCLF